jgi:TolB-like protein
MHRRVWIGMVAAFLVSAIPLRAQENEIKSLAEELSRSISNGPHRTVAVVDFTDLQGNVTNLGRYMAAELESALANAGGNIDLVDRTRLQLLMQEHKLAGTGIIDPSTARQLGRIAGVQVLVSGTLTPLGDTVRMTVKALDTESARVVASYPRSILKTRDIVQLLGQPEAVPNQPVAEDLLTSPQGPGAPSPTTPSPSTKSVSIQQIDFVLKSCILSGRSLSCGLLITNRADDRDLDLFVGRCHNSLPRLIDSDGNEFHADSVTLGMKETGCGDLQGTLVSGVSTKAALNFENVSAILAMIPRMDIEGEVAGHHIAVQFRNIPVLPKR